MVAGTEQAIREEARRDMRPPLLDPTSNEPLVIEFADNILDFLGDANGINVTDDERLEDASHSVELAGVTFRRLSSGSCRPTRPSTRWSTRRPPSSRRRRRRKPADYAKQVIRTFYVPHGNLEELSELLRAIVVTPQVPVRPQFVPNAAANTITMLGDGVGRVEVERAAGRQPDSIGVCSPGSSASLRSAPAARGWQP